MSRSAPHPGQKLSILTQADTVSASQLCWLFIWTWQNIEDYVSPSEVTNAQPTQKTNQNAQPTRKITTGTNSPCWLVLLFSPEFAKKEEFSIASVIRRWYQDHCCMLFNLKCSAVTQFVSRFLPFFCGQDILVADILIVSVWHVVLW